MRLSKKTIDTFNLIYCELYFVGNKGGHNLKVRRKIKEYIFGLQDYDYEEKCELWKKVSNIKGIL